MKPILFNTEMVRAILEGRKTTTRRVIKPQLSDVWCTACEENMKLIAGTSRYQPGDILWVRETWAMAPDLLGEFPGPIYKADYLGKDLDDAAQKNFHWSPSIHMPREAARLFLLVTDVRVERLQEITGYQARREGMNPIVFAQDRQAVDDAKCIRAFTSVWDTTIKPADREQYGWNANPWVWVIEFERCEKPKEAAHAES